MREADRAFGGGVNDCVTFTRWRTEKPNGKCRGCDKLLKRNADGSTSRSLVWCSAICNRWFRKNHMWTYAREAALRRDGYKCRRCGSGSSPTKEQRDAHLIAIAEMSSKAREAAHRRFFGNFTLEVNHIEPRRGRGYHFGCWNHLVNLETLCRNCHVIETNRQREERRAAAVAS